MDKNNLIPAEELVQKAIEAGFNFGKTKPRNRLRYFHSIGLIPRPIRKQIAPGSMETIAYYPAETLQILLDLQGKKGHRKNFSTEQLTKLKQVSNNNQTQGTGDKGQGWGKGTSDEVINTSFQTPDSNPDSRLQSPASQIKPAGNWAEIRDFEPVGEFGKGLAGAAGYIKQKKANQTQVSGNSNETQESGDNKFETQESGGGEQGWGQRVGSKEVNTDLFTLDSNLDHRHLSPASPTSSPASQNVSPRRKFVTVGLGMMMVLVAFLGATIVLQNIGGAGEMANQRAGEMGNLVGVLAETTIKPTIDINADTNINGDLYLKGVLFSGLIPNQTLNIGSAPSFSTLKLTSTTNQITNSTGKTYSFPDASGTLVLVDATQTLTNKTISGASNTITNIPNIALSNSTIGITAGTNLTGGGTISLGSSATISLKDDINIASLSATNVYSNSDATVAGTLYTLGILKLAALGATPSAVGVGSAYYDTNSNSLRVYNGTSWGSVGGAAFWSTLVGPTGDVVLDMSTYKTTWKWDGTGQIDFHGVENDNLLRLTADSGMAALVIDNAGGDVFSASSSGQTLLTLDSSGNLIPGTNATQTLGSPTNYFATVYATNLYTGETGVSGLWQRSAGAVAPATLSDAFLLGATATGSAKFSVSGGNVVIGQSVSDTLVVNAAVTSNFVPDMGSLYDLGSNTRRWKTIYADNLIGSVSGNIDVTGTTSEDFRINSDNGTEDLQDSTLTFERGLPTVNAEMRWNSGTDRYLSLNAPLMIYPDTGIPDGGHAALMVDQRYNEDIFSASLAGVTKFTINSAGNVGIGTTTPTSLFQASGFGTAQVASVSAGTGMAGLIVDNTVGDLFTASSSGMARFVITQNGNVGIGTTTPTAMMQISSALAGTTFFDINNGSSLFNITDTAVTSNLPVNFTSPGDVSIAYDLVFNNPTISNITSISPLVLAAGEMFNSSDLTLRTYNLGNVVVDSQSLFAMYSATVAGQLSVGTSSATPNIGNFYLTNNQTYGKALAILNQTESADIFTASASGVTKFTINSAGDVRIADGSLYFRSSVVDNNFFVAKDNSGDYLKFGGFGGLNFTAGTAGATQLGLWDTTKLYVNASVGVGVASPLATLDVRGNSGITPVASISGQTAFASMVVDNKGVGDLFTASSSGLSRFVITQNGNVGIGTTSPASALNIVGGEIWQFNNGNDPRFVIGDSTTSTEYGGLKWISTGNYLQVGTNINTYELTMRDGGVGVGTTGPVGRFDVRGLNATTSVASVSGSTNFASLVVDNTIGDLFTASSSGLSRFVITQNGNVGIGTSDPGSLLHVAGTADVTGALFFNKAGSSVTYMDQMWGLKIHGDNTHPVEITSTSLGIGYDLADSSSFGSGNLYVANSVGIGTVSPLATLDTRGQSGTLPVASISGQTSFAAMVVDNKGVGDLFTASSSGLTRFVITQNGNIGVGTTTPTAMMQISSAIAGTTFLDINNGSSLFSVTDTAVTSSLPMNFTSPGDLALAYDLSLTNSTISNIYSAASLNITAGRNYNSDNLTLGTYNAGNVIVDSQAFVTNYAATVSGQLAVGTTSGQLTHLTNGGIGAMYVRNAQTFGKALVTLDQWESQDILTASAAGTTKFVINNAGNVGINTASPRAMLDVVSASTSTSSAFIENTYNGDSTGLTIKLNKATLGNANHFINFLNAAGDIVGNIRANATGVQYQTEGIADFGEFMKVRSYNGYKDYKNYNDYISAEFSPGTIVCQGTGGVEPCQASASAKVIGVISDTTSFLGGKQTKDSVIVGFLGQITVKMASSSATIQPGDMVTTTYNGYGTKATGRGYTIGMAVEEQVCAAGNQCSVLVKVNPGWHDPFASGSTSLSIAQGYNPIDLGSVLASQSGIFANANLELSTISANDATFSGVLNVLGNSQLYNTSIVGTLDVGLLHFDDIKAEISSLTGNLTINSNLAVMGDASVSGQLKVGQGMVLKDKLTGEDYCVQVKNGTLVTTKGSCK